jgi:DNA-binding protein H-NS
LREVVEVAFIRLWRLPWTKINQPTKTTKTFSRDVSWRAGMNLTNLTIDELVVLRGDVETQLQTLVAARQDELKAEADRLSAINGKAVLKPSKRSVKYRDGSNEWSGTGSMPGWLTAKKALGEDVERYRVREAV